MISKIRRLWIAIQIGLLWVRATVHYEKRRFTEGIATVERAQRIGGKQAIVDFDVLRGALEYNLGNYDRSIESFTTAYTRIKNRRKKLTDQDKYLMSYSARIAGWIAHSRGLPMQMTLSIDGLDYKIDKVPIGLRKTFPIKSPK